MTVLPDTAHLPFHFKGHPVPWVTRWTHEVVGEMLKPEVDPNTLRVRLTYPDGLEFRDEHDFLWQREGIMRGGVPEFSQVSTYRQRASVRKRLCQICGKKIDTRPIRWVVPQGQLDHIQGQAITSTPPCCNECVEISLAICPNLTSKPPEIYRVLEYSVWGVQGEAVQFNPETMSLQRSNGIAVPNEAGRMIGFLAKQQLVRFDKYVPEGS